MDGAQIGIIGGILGSTLGLIGAIIGVYYSFFQYVRNLFGDESLDNAQRKVKILNYIRFVFVLTLLMLLWFCVVQISVVIAKPNLIFIISFGGSIIFIAAMAACFYFMKGGRDALKYSFKQN